MEIGKTDTSGIGATVRTLSATTTASTTTTSQTTSASQSSGTGGSATSSKYYPAATGSLRTQSPAILTESQDDSLSKLNTDTFAKMVGEKTKAFAKTLVDAFTAAKIPTDEPIVLRIDGAGRVTTDGAYKKRIDKLFEENPELEKQFKDVAALNSLVALNQAMRRYSESKKKAQNDDEHDQASADYLRDCLSIQMRSDTLTLSDGALTSPAMTYMATGK